MQALDRPAPPDPRHIGNGLVIPTEGYSDQPFVVQTDDGAWLCCVTTGAGQEGDPGQRVVTLRSLDGGRTWSEPVPVEPGDPHENSYAVMLKVSSGRIYIFYNHNTDGVREVRRHDGKPAFCRVDSLGHFVFKYSDDHGRSWSAGRYDIPIRLFRCDRENVYGGALRFFWNVGRPLALAGKAYVPHIKVGQMGPGFFAQSEGVLLVSDNLLTESDPDGIRWETLPDGDEGLRAPPGGGPIAEEQSYCALSDGSLYCVYRGIDGYPMESYSRDGGRTWAEPRYKCFADGRRMKHPRAANFAWRCRNGQYLYWFHNHGGRVLREHPAIAEWAAYEDRNPVWLSAGVEIETAAGREIAWSEPQLALYDNDPFTRMSYPDLIEDGGRYFLTETQKRIARVHEIPATWLEEMWVALEMSLGRSPGVSVPDEDRLLLTWTVREEGARPASVPMPALPGFRVRDAHPFDFRGRDTAEGLAIELWLTLSDLSPGRTLLDNRDAAGRGFCLSTVAGGALELTLHDGQTENRWPSDRVLRAGGRHHVVVNVDGGPRVISFVVDGRFCDGGDERPFGWGRFSPNLRHINGAKELRVATEVEELRLYARPLRTAEAVRQYYQGRT